MKLFLLFLACLGLSNAATTVDTQALAFLAKVSENLYKITDQIAADTFNADDVDFEEAFEKVSSLKSVAEELRSSLNETERFDISQIQNEDLKKAMKHFKKSYNLFLMDDTDFSELTFVTEILKVFLEENKFTPYQKDSEETEERFNLPQSLNIVSKSKDPKEVLHYWLQFREKGLLFSKIKFATMIENYREKAEKSDFPLLELWFKTYDDPKFMEKMDVVIKQIKPFYQQLHAFIRNQLQKKYGKEIVPSTGPIPDHLYEQAFLQVWSPNSIIESFFPFSGLPDIDATLKEKKFDALKLMKTASEFYESLGLEPLSQEFWEKRTKVQEEDEDSVDCKPEMYADSPKTYLAYCKKVSFRKFLQAHSNMAALHYAEEKKDLPYYYFESYELEVPLGEAVLISASTHKHLEAVDLLPEIKNKDAALMNRLLRMSLHTMMSVPRHYVNAKFMTGLITGEYKSDDVNQVYWKLMDEFVGVEAPLDRTDEFDPPHKFFENMDENHNTRKFVSEILGYQMYNAFCLKSGAPVTAEELHKCDFYKNKDVGKSLKEMMKLGSKKSWSEVIATVLPEGKATLDAEALLTYYAPVQKWLEEKNKEENVKTGWEASTRKIIDIPDEEDKKEEEE